MNGPFVCVNTMNVFYPHLEFRMGGKKSCGQE